MRLSETSRFSNVSSVTDCLYRGQHCNFSADRDLESTAVRTPFYHAAHFATENLQMHPRTIGSRKRREKYIDWPLETAALKAILLPDLIHPSY